MLKRVQHDKEMLRPFDKLRMLPTFAAIYILHLGNAQGRLGSAWQLDAETSSAWQGGSAWQGDASTSSAWQSGSAWQHLNLLTRTCHPELGLGSHKLQANFVTLIQTCIEFNQGFKVLP